MRLLLLVVRRLTGWLAMVEDDIFIISIIIIIIIILMLGVSLFSLYFFIFKRDKMDIEDKKLV